MSDLTLDAIPQKTVEWMTDYEWFSCWLRAHERLAEKGIERDPTEEEVEWQFEVWEDELDHAESDCYPEEVSA